MPTHLSNILKKSKQLFDSFFESYTKELFSPKTRITDACMYSLSAGGKRIRPIFVINSFFNPEDLLKESDQQKT